MMSLDQRQVRAVQKAATEKAHVLAVRGRDGIYQVRSATDPSEKYMLTARNAAAIECSCRAAQYQLPCWHVEKLRNRLIRQSRKEVAA